MVETVACNLCSSSEARARPEKTRFLNIEPPFGIAECLSCGFLFQSPRPTLVELKKMYATHPYYSEKNASRGERRTGFYEARMRRLESFKPKRGDVLSIGCLEGGYFLKVARSFGWQVEGVEFSEILREHARSALDIDVKLAEGWDLASFAGNLYDVIYSHSLEHVLDARRTLQQCRGLLKQDGLLVLEVPNQFYSLKDKLKAGFLALTGHRTSGLFYQETKAEFHTYFFNPRTLRRILTSEGFELLSFRTYMPSHPVYTSNPTGRWLQEAIYAVGGIFERGPSMEAIARVT
ncbi:MAG TPA: class I SAM-dependent methyltransferase [Kiloniellales bacterium]